MKQMSKAKSLSVLLVSLFILLFNVIKLKTNPAISLILAALASIYMGMIFGNTWEKFEADIGDTIQKMFVGILIMMFVGILIGTWMSSGTIPILMYYGLKYLSPKIFLVATCLLCCVMSLMTGTSWGTIGTIGVALLGVSEGLGIPVKYSAGAIVVGAIFGDKLSPLSDTTVVAPSVSGVNIIDHIKAMLYTTVPCLIVSLIMYFLIGLNFDVESIRGEEYFQILQILETKYNLEPILLMPPILVLILIFLKKPTLPTFGIGIIVAMALSIIVQHNSLSDVLSSAVNGLQTDTGMALLNKMINRGGLFSMMSSVALILGAALFSASLKANNVFTVFLGEIEKFAKTKRSLLFFSYALHLILASLTGVYLVTFSILGPMLAPLFDKFDLNRKNLSRMLEDTGTAFSPIVPWSNISIFILGTLGLSSFEYILYAPMTYLGVVFATIYIITGFGIFDSSGRMLYKKID